MPFHDPGQAAFVDREQHDLFGLARPGVGGYEGGVYFGVASVDGIDVLAEAVGEMPASRARILAIRHMLSEMEATKKVSVGPMGSYSASTSEVCF